MKKFLPHLIMFTVVLVAVIVANQLTTLKEVGSDGKVLADGKSYKNKIGFGRKKK